MISTRTFLKRLVAGNLLAVAIFALLAVLYVSPNCPGEYCDWQVDRFSLGAVIVLVSANLTAVSLFFAVRFWRK